MSETATLSTPDSEIPSLSGQIVSNFVLCIAGTSHAFGPGMYVSAEALRARTKQFACDVIGLVSQLPRHVVADVIGRQLVRAASGVASNYRAAGRSRSHKEFVARLGVVLEESDESELWLEILKVRHIGGADVVARLWQEATELRAIFSAAVRTARTNSSQSRQ